MIIKYLSKNNFLVFLGLLFIVLVSISSVFGQGVAVLRVNRIFAGVVDNGGQGSFDYTGGWFPADYDCIGDGMREELGKGVTGGGMITMAKNWVNPKTDEVIEYAVIKLNDILNLGQVTEPIENYIRYGYPRLAIDWTDYTLDDFGTVDPNKLIGTSDQTVTVTYRNDMGVEIERTIFAWGQQYHDDYIVVDLVLTNVSGDTLKDFWVALYNSWAYCQFAKGRNPSVDIYGSNIGSYMMLPWCHYYGSSPGDSLRIWYLYQADDPDKGGDQMGLPAYTQDGRLLTSNILYYTILHASQNPYKNDYDDIDDPLQPKATSAFSDFVLQFNFGKIDGREKIYEVLTGKYWADRNELIEDAYPGTFHRINNDEQGSPEFTCIEGFSKESPWHKAWSGFGPYETFAPGEKIHIVYATGIQGLRPKKEKEIGEKWKNGTLEDPPNLPNEETGYFPENFVFPSTDVMDIRKDKWISTVIDSVHKSASRIKWNYEHNWMVPGAPPPPDSVIVTGYGDGVEIKWSCAEAEEKDYFYGYRILKKIGRMDTVFYELAKFLPKDSIELGEVHSWKDTTILFGASYYYYVQTGYIVDENHPQYNNAYPTTKGKLLWSNRLWVPNLISTKPPRPPQDDLSKIVIAPNPYNIRDPLLGGYGVSDEGYRLIMFFNLPAFCTIRIYTESGDLVKKIVHDNPSRVGVETWDMLTENQQAISSGVYIVVFEKPNGEVAYQKLVVVR